MMRSMLLAAGLLLAAGAAQADVKLIHAGHLVDVEQGRVRDRVTVVVDGDRIRSVDDGYRAPAAGESLIDLDGYTLMPGFMDMHTHLTMQFSKDAYSEEFRLDPADVAYRAQVYAKRTLLAGFTTVRDVGDSYDVSRALRDAINQGLVIGPRIWTATEALGTTGGHMDPTDGWNAELRGDPSPKDGVFNGPAEAWKAVRQRYKEGADLIKIGATGGVLSIEKHGGNPQMTEEEIRAVVAAANDYGFRVAAHAHGTEGIKRAVRGGVTSIEHGTYLDDEAMRLMKQKGTWLVPTLSAGNWVLEKSKIDGFFPEVVRVKAAEVGAHMRENFARAYRYGLRIAFGTDTGVSAHGDNAHEFQFMVEDGMTPMDAIRSSTLTAAQLLGDDADLGTVAAGKYADLVAVQGDPLADVKLLQHVGFVMKGGVVYLGPGS